MTATARILRRAALALVALALLAAGSAYAQDPRSSVVHNAARDWLALTDRLDAGASFVAAGARFREPISAEMWAEALAKARVPMGPVLQRTMVETNFERASPGGGPEAEIATILYRTAFANRTANSESVTLELEPDGAWRVIGYYIR